MMNKLILITGGSASGKTHLAGKLVEFLGDRAIFLSQDSFYKPIKGESFNYDVPEAFDFEKQHEVLQKLINNKTAEVPVYNFGKSEVSGTKTVEPADYIIFEGLFTFWDYKLVKKADFQIFVDTPSDTRLARRIIRDVNQRSRKPEMIIQRWLSDVQPSYRKHISQMRRYADVIVPWHKLKDRTIKSLIVTIASLNTDIDALEALKK